MRKSPHIRRFLTARSGNQLQPLVEYANYLAGITKKLRDQLDPMVSKHIAIANIHGDRATILVNSSTWMGKIRYLEPMILESLKQQGLPLKQLDFKVDPTHTPPPKTIPNQAKMSKETSELLESMAETSDDPALREALKRLAKHGRSL
jgi:hypothetical protein